MAMKPMKQETPIERARRLLNEGKNVNQAQLPGTPLTPTAPTSITKPQGPRQTPAMPGSGRNPSGGGNTGNTGAPIYAPQQTATGTMNVNTAPSDLSQGVDAALRELLRGPRDTAAEEEAARKERERQTGQSIADARAQAGFGGFGLSGASQAMQSDIRSKAADDLMNDILGIKQDARDDYLESIGKAIDYDLGSQQTEVTNKAFDLMMEQLEAVQDIDLNDDGFINGKPAEGTVGDGNVDNNPSAPTEAEIDEAELEGDEMNDAYRGRHTNDEDRFSDDPPGDVKNPYGSNTDERESLEAQGFVFTATNEKGPFGLTLYRDQNGRHWYFDGEAGWW